MFSEPRPIASVSRPHDTLGGTELSTFTRTWFDVIAPDAAVMCALEFRIRPFTIPVATPTLTLVGASDAQVKLPPGMKNPFASLPRALSCA